MSETPILHALSLAIGAAETASDAELLRRFAESGDRSAFELVVRRHADLVWGVCRSALSRDRQTAEDAFQATFLALVRKAGSVRAGSAAGWLFRVARNAAVRARGRVAGRATDPLPDALAAADRPTEEQVALHEVAPVVAEEVDRLGSNLREPVVLCFFEGHTHAEAATRLGWPIGTVASRLARAKDLLRDRLTRRGVALPAGGLAAVFAVTGSPVRAAVAIATVPASQLSPNVRSLAEGVLSTMRVTKLKTIAVVAVAVLGMAGAAVALAGTLGGRETATEATSPNEQPGAKADQPKLKALEGTWRVLSSSNCGREALAFELVKGRIVIKKDVWTDNDRESDTPLTMALRFPDKAGEGAIDFVVTGGPRELSDIPIPGIYKLEGDRLTICTRDLESLKKGRPTDFKPDETNAVTVLERVKDEKGELAALAGEWRPVSVNVSDRVVEVQKGSWTIKGTDVAVVAGGETSAATIKVNPVAVPPAIDLTVAEGAEKGTVMKGIYFRTDDALVIAFHTPDAKKGDRPSELKPGEGVGFTVLERVTQPKEAKDEKSELKALSGEWVGVKMSVSGKDAPANEIAKMKWIIKGAEITLMGEGEGENGEKATLKLDPTAKPATINMTLRDGPENGHELVGIYLIEKDKVTFCFGDPKSKKKDTRPTEFKPGDGVIYAVLKRDPKAVRP